MSLRTTRGLLFASSLALGFAAVGCGDDDKTPRGDDDEMDAGGDAGKPDGSATKPDASANGTITCGDNQCTPGSLVGSPIGACCAEGNVCGLQSDDIKKVNPASNFTGCMPKDVMAASASTHCGNFLDQVEPDPFTMGDDKDTKNADAHKNGGLDVPSMGASLVFDGCCLPSGECGALLRTPRTYDPSFLDLHLGCVSISALQSSLGGGEGGMSRPAPTLAPYCNPTSGEQECPAKMGLLCASVKAQFAAKNVPFECTADTAMPSWACALAGLPRNGAPVAVTEACLDGLPFAAQGCGEMVNEAPMGSSCLPRVPATKFGCGAAPMAGAVVPNVPKFVCGCGEGKGATNPAQPCIPNAKSDVCGSANPTDEQRAQVPEFLCGCGETVAQTPAGQPSKLCLSYLPTTTCGTKAIEAGAPELTQVPAFICGAEGNPDTSAFPKLRGVPATVCGTKPVTNASPELAAVPEYLCGCLNETIPQANCLRNVEATVCGTQETVVGKRANPADTTAMIDCLEGVPEYARGCGPAASPSLANSSCLRHAEAHYGCVNTVVDTKDTPALNDDCLVGVPEYAVGCGDTAPTGSPNCLAYAPQFLGCVNVVSSPRSLPEYLCGCGDSANQTSTGLADTALPCLPQVATNICGAVSIGASLLVNPAIPNQVCGCGDGVQTNAAVCLDNVPFSVCGGMATCIAGTCAGTCQDLFGGEGSLAGGQGGTGDDGILDTCVP